MNNGRIEFVINEIIDQYLYADNTKKPWIIGFSGGKDSTVLLTLVWKALTRIKENTPYPYQLKRPVFVVCNDTMVENPIIVDYVGEILEKIEKAARDQDLPIFKRKTIPRLEESFWVNIIGRGYPIPNNTFRWCTDKLKIKPTSRFITEQVNQNGEAIILLGTRSDESQTRARTIKKHQIKGKRLTKHPNQYNTFVFAPIKHLMLEEIWQIINKYPSPWGGDNAKLFQIYSDASADDYECPTMVTDKDHTSCGKSRFGCWTCTVIKEDKSMSALIKNGFEWLKPLFGLRNDMAEERNKVKNRSKYRRNGQLAINDLGTYLPSYRAKLLRQVLEAQQTIQKEKPHIELITNQELVAIQVIWYRDLIFDYKVSNIYNKIYNQEIDMKKDNEKIQKEVSLLKDVCQENPEDFDIIQELLVMQKNKALLNRKRGLKEDMERVIEKYIYAN